MKAVAVPENKPGRFPELLSFFRKNQINFLILLVYILLHIFLISQHEPVRDEAQAWTIAGNTSLPELFSVLSEEGHPALWFLFLRPFAKLGFPYAGLSFLSLLLTSFALAVLLFRSGFSLPAKLCIACSSLFLYYNPVIARVYAIIPLTVFLIADFWKERRQHPILIGILIALLFQSHIVMAGFAGGLLFILFLDLFRKEQRSRKSAAGLLIGFCGAAATFFELYQFDTDATHYIDSSAGSILSRISLGSFLQGLRQIISALWPFERGFSMITGSSALFLYILFLAGAVFLPVLWGITAARSGKLHFYLELLIALFCGVGFIVAVYAWVYEVLYQTLTCILAILVFFFWSLPSCLRTERQKKTAATILSLLFLMSAPTAVKAAVGDVRFSCSDAENTAVYMAEILPEGSVVAVRSNSFVPSVCAPLSSLRPDLRLVNIDTGLDFTVYDWTVSPERSAEELTEAALLLADTEHVYYLSPVPFDFTGSFSDCIYQSPVEGSTWEEEFALFRLR